MHEKTWMRSSSFRSDNRKSKIQNRKLVGIVAIGVTFAMCVAVAQAQHPTKIPRIGYLNAVSPSAVSDRIEALRRGLRELGYVEGKTLSLSLDMRRENSIVSPRLRLS
jgi:hypothetical protein